MEEIMKRVRRSAMIWAVGFSTAMTLSASTIAHAAPPLPASEVTSPEERATVTVHITSPTFAELRRRPRGSGAPFEFACDAPCDREMPLGDDYEIIGAGAVLPVTLASTPGETVNIDVSPPSDGKKIGGALMIASGAVVFVFGAVVGVFGMSQPFENSARDVWLGGALTLTGVALALGIGGGVLYSKASSTDVTTKTEPRALPSVPHSDDLFVRTPTWRALDAFDRAAKAPSAVPIFSRAF
jgi:hypothetical protein